MKKIFLLICPIICHQFCNGQNDSSFYVKLRFNVIKNFPFGEDSLSQKLVSEIYFVTFYEQDKKLDSFSIWKNGNAINYKKLEHSLKRSLTELKGIEMNGFLMVPVIIYNIDNKSLKSYKSRELQEYLKVFTEDKPYRINENFVILKSIVLTQMIRADNKKTY
jgi:hypothetical protein